METFLITQRGEDIGRRYDLDALQLTLGRGSDNDLVLNDPMVSRYHAVLKRQGGRYTLTDLGSSNPVVVNDQVLEPGLPHQLNHRDVIFIGKTVFSFQSRGADTRAQQAQQGQGAARAPQTGAAGQMQPPQPMQQTQTMMPPVPPPAETQMMRPGTGNLGGPGGSGNTGAMSGPGAMGRTQEPPTPMRPAGQAGPTGPSSMGGPGGPGAGPGADRPGEGPDDNFPTIIGRVQLGEPAGAQTPPPAPNFPPPPPPAPPGRDEDDEAPTSSGLRAPMGMPPLPPLGGAPGGPGTPPPAPGGPPRPGNAPPAEGASSDEDDDEHPTVFIPRDRH